MTRNPRDGLVTLIAYARGEEFFHDDNGNGIWDSGEAYYDQGEPYVDANDNGVRDYDELYVDVDEDGSWDPPNNKYDPDTTIWTFTHVLYSGFPVYMAARMDRDDENSARPNLYEYPTAGNVFSRYDTIDGCYGFDSTDMFEAYFADRNLNRVQADHEFTVEAINGTLSVKLFDEIGLDGFGFGIQIGWFDKETAKPCNLEMTNAICHQKVRFFNWEQGYTGSVTYSNTTSAHEDPEMKQDRLRVSLEVQGKKKSIDFGSCTWK